jgi:penicillin-insensitive murein DD-endopeptidase
MRPPFSTFASVDEKENVAVTQLHRRWCIHGFVCAGLLAAAAASLAWDSQPAPASGPPEAVGSYARGCIIGAHALPAEGEGYQVLRVRRERHYGHPKLTAFIEELGERVTAAGLGTLLIGDLAQPRGGPMPWGHASHQTGLDADIFLRLDAPRLPPEERETLELASKVGTDRRQVNSHFGPAQAELIRMAASDPRVARIFVNPPIKRALCDAEWKDRSFLRTVRPWNGHTRHMHVRLHCPQESHDCQVQVPPPPGDGCGAELAAWFERPAEPAEPGESPPAREPPELPSRCAALR